MLGNCEAGRWLFCLRKPRILKVNRVESHGRSFAAGFSLGLSDHPAPPSLPAAIAPRLSPLLFSPPLHFSSPWVGTHHHRTAQDGFPSQKSPSSHHTCQQTTPRLENPQGFSLWREFSPAAPWAPESTTDPSHLGLTLTGKSFFYRNAF